jgi:hypothetical protein
MALADANRAHGEIAARRAIPFQRSAFSEPRPTSLEAIFGDGSVPRGIARSCCPSHRRYQFAAMLGGGFANVSYKLLGLAAQTLSL